MIEDDKLEVSVSEEDLLADLFLRLEESLSLVVLFAR